MLSEKPENLIRIAVAGMLPKNSLGRKMLKKLKIYSGGAHPHEAQCPQAWTM
jgi:large subunit ribosomal protein L13